MKMKSANGERLFKTLHIRIVTPPPLEEGKIVYRAPAGRGYSARAIEEILEKCAASCEKVYPGLEFGLVELAPDRFNFVYQGPRATSA